MNTRHPWPVSDDIWSQSFLIDLCCGYYLFCVDSSCTALAQLSTRMGAVLDICRTDRGGVEKIEHVSIWFTSLAQLNSDARVARIRCRCSHIIYLFLKNLLTFGVDARLATPWANVVLKMWECTEQTFPVLAQIPTKQQMQSVLRVDKTEKTSYKCLLRHRFETTAHARWSKCGIGLWRCA